MWMKPSFWRVVRWGESGCVVVVVVEVVVVVVVVDMIEL